MDQGKKTIAANLPDGVRCAVALSYDLEMCKGYSTEGINHGRIMPPVQEYTLRLCDVAERYNTRLHFFFVCNGLEEDDISYLEEVVRRGHTIDNHTYSHQGLATMSPEELDKELSRANQLLEQRLNITSTVLRGPYGYENGWNDLHHENRLIILKNGFKWVSGEISEDVYHNDRDYWVSAPSRTMPYVYPEGLVEIPVQGWTDRMWFDLRPEIDQSIVATWRYRYGHKPVPEGWKADWLADNALDDWISLNLETLDYAYQHRLLWVPAWHPYTHYLHDPENLMLEALLQHAASKLERVWVCTVRDAMAMLSSD
jgi:peptidoglycan/xylan/chitin deacetylase (PgdA/CDA1 family)